jgi:hypothetical protein
VPENKQPWSTPAIGSIDSPEDLDAYIARAHNEAQRQQLLKLQAAFREARHKDGRKRKADTLR